MIGSTVCSTIDVIQGDKIDQWNRDHIQCVVFKDQLAGEYGFREHLKPGFAKLKASTYQTSYFTGKNYTQRIAAKISSFPFHVGGTNGHRL